MISVCFYGKVHLREQFAFIPHSSAEYLHRLAKKAAQLVNRVLKKVEQSREALVGQIEVLIMYIIARPNYPTFSVKAGALLWWFLHASKFPRRAWSYSTSWGVCWNLS